MLTNIIKKLNLDFLFIFNIFLQFKKIIFLYNLLYNFILAYTILNIRISTFSNFQISTLEIIYPKKLFERFFSRISVFLLSFSTKLEIFLLIDYYQ